MSFFARGYNPNDEPDYATEPCPEGRYKMECVDAYERPGYYDKDDIDLILNFEIELDGLNYILVDRLSLLSKSNRQKQVNGRTKLRDLLLAAGHEGEVTDINGILKYKKIQAEIGVYPETEKYSAKNFVIQYINDDAESEKGNLKKERTSDDIPWG